MNNLEELLKKITGKVDKGVDNLSQWAGASQLSSNTTDLIGLGGNALSNILSNGLETKAGSVINTAGSVVGAINPIAGLAVKAVGGLYNGAFGYDYNDEYINQANQLAASHANREFNTTSNTQLASDILNAGTLGTISKESVGKEGWLSNKVTKKTNELNSANLEANIAAHKNAVNTAERMEKTTMGNMLKNYKEFGGSLHSNGSIWDTGLNMINNGGKHEESIYGGVPSGVDSGGVPNLVEEGEVIYDDYVFSDTLEVPRELVKKYKLPKKSTYADAINHLSKEYQEKPNDPIMKKWFGNIYAEFAQSQEQVRLQEELLNNMNLAEMLNMANYDSSENIFGRGGRKYKHLTKPVFIAGDSTKYAEYEKDLKEYYAERGRYLDEEGVLRPKTQYGGGKPSGGGAGTSFITLDSLGQYPYDYVKNTPIPMQRSFSDAFAEASKAGLPTFIFNGKEYSTEISDNPNYVGKQYETFIPFNLREVLDPNTMVPIEDSTKIELYKGQIPGTHKREINTYNTGGDKDKGIQITPPSTPLGVSGYGYDFDTFLKEDSPFSTYSVSKQPGGTAGTYKIDTNFNLGNFKTIRDLENSKDYQAFTNYVINNPTDPNVLRYLKAANNATHSKKLFDADGNLVSNWVDLFRGYRTDGAGGIYHFTPEKTVVTSTPMDYTQYIPRWDPSLSRVTPFVPFTGSDKEIESGRKTDIDLSDLLRTAPVVGSTAQVIADMFGANDPDYTDVNVLMQAARDLRGIDFTPIGGHLAFNPYNTDYYSNQLLAQANTGNRAALNNSSGNRATALTGLLGSNYNTIKGLGELYRQGEESNLANLLSIAQYNNAINQYNSQGALDAAKSNASINNARASIINKAVNLSDDITSASSAAKSANLENFYTNLGLLGQDLFNKDTLQMLIDNRVIVNKDGKYEIDQEKLEKLLNSNNRED